MIEVKEISAYKNYGRVVSISNGVIEAYVTVDIGPRIIRFGYVGSQNIMNDDTSNFTPATSKEFEDYFGEGKAFNNYGGHRVWLSPESYPETYYPDCNPVSYEVLSDGAVFTPPAEYKNDVLKQITVRMDPDDTNLQLKMKVTNLSNKVKTFSIWGLTVSAKGGTLIVPMNTRNTGLLSNRIISVWPYTDLSDKRIYFGKKYVTLKQSEISESPIKLGFDLNCGSVYYLLNDDVFVKSFATNHPLGSYPDGGCSFETYTNEGFLEVESLSELSDVLPNASAEHTERWSLIKKPCDVDTKNDDSISAFLGKL